jgi:hypothetical protein
MMLELRMYKFMRKQPVHFVAAFQGADQILIKRFFIWLDALQSYLRRLRTELVRIDPSAVLHSHQSLPYVRMEEH